MECWLGAFVIFQGIETTIVMETYIKVFVIFQGGGGVGPPALTLSGSAYAGCSFSGLCWFPPSVLLAERPITVSKLLF